MALYPTTMTLALSIITGISFLWWAELALEWTLARRRSVDLADVQAGEGQVLPSLSVVVPARNEESVLDEAARSLLAALPDGGRVVLVDDRSTDGTAEVARRLAAEDRRLRLVQVEDLPHGWLGKVYALQAGADASDGEWILFADADVKFRPGSLARALVYCRQEGLDHLVVTPEMETRGFWERVFVLFFLVVFSGRYRTWRAPNIRSRFYAGLGAFNMVRRDAYRRAGEHRALRAEVIDDLGLGAAIKRSGGRTGILRGNGFLSVRWNVGLRGLLGGVEKNAYAAFEFRPIHALGGIAAVLASTIVPASAPVLFRSAPLTAAAGLGVWVAMAFLYRQAARHTDIGPILFWTFPLGAALLSWGILRSAALYHLRGGIIWRGTVYGKVRED